MTLSPSTTQPAQPAISSSSEELAERGWRIEISEHPDGTERYDYIPLTEEEFLHPQEGYRLPNNTFHDTVISDARDMLQRRYQDDVTIAVFRDLIIEWDDPDLQDHCPDVFVVFGVQERDRQRPKFIVADEEARPVFILEVVSPRYRTTDRTTKVIQYEQAGVQEYMIVDQRKQRGQTIEEVLGYHLVQGRYQPIVPDNEGRIISRVLGLRFRMQEHHLVLEDSETGERLRTSSEEQAARRAAEEQARRAKEQAHRAEERARAAETENADLKARLQALQAQIEGGSTGSVGEHSNGE